MFKSKQRSAFILMTICFLVASSFVVAGSSSRDSQSSEALSSMPVSHVSSASSQDDFFLSEKTRRSSDCSGFEAQSSDGLSSSAPLSSPSLGSYSSPASKPDLPVVIHSYGKMLGRKRSRQSAEAEQTGPVCIDLVAAIVAVYEAKGKKTVSGIPIRTIAYECSLCSRNEAGWTSFVFKMPDSYKGPKTNLLVEYTDGSWAKMTPTGNESEYVYKVLSKKD